MLAYLLYPAFTPLFATPITEVVCQHLLTLAPTMQCFFLVIIGVSVSKPHTSELNGGFSLSLSLYIYMYRRSYVVPYIFDTVI